MNGGVIPGSVVGEMRMGMIDPSYKPSHQMGSWSHSRSWNHIPGCLINVPTSRPVPGVLMLNYNTVLVGGVTV